jgi:hypothetical protein
MKYRYFCEKLALAFTALPVSQHHPSYSIKTTNKQTITKKWVTRKRKLPHQKCQKSNQKLVKVERKFAARALKRRNFVMLALLKTDPSRTRAKILLKLTKSACVARDSWWRKAYE